MVDVLGRALVLVGWCLGAAAQWTVPVEHSIGNSPWEPRGELRLREGREAVVSSATFHSEVLSGEFLRRLHAAAKAGGAYRVRVPTSLQAPIDPHDFHFSSLPACRLVAGRLEEELTVSVDSSRGLLASVSLKAGGGRGTECGGVELEELPETFNASVRVVDVVEGPAPETAAYVAKLEQQAMPFEEREERIRGGEGDQRSFLGKYWMYIVPVVIFLMFSSAQNPEGGGQQG